MVLARVTSKGQITIPKMVRERLGIEPGDSLEFQFEDDHLEVRPVRRRRLMEFRGLFRVPKDEARDFAEERERAWAARAHQILEAGKHPDE